MGRFGGMISPFVLELGKVNAMIPTLIVSTVCYITAYTTTKLPETNKRPLLQSHAEAEKFYDDFKYKKV